MSQQLIFTSAVRGISPGSSGYCTVARSVEMREGLVSRLEQLSVYQHLQSGVNPMVLSHRILSLRGTMFHVLSRTVDAGLDYTNRTNFIAHHVVFQPHELHGACSPADFFLYWPGWLSSWEGDPAWTDDQAASLHSVQGMTSLPAENWAGWSGNAGNASLLIDAGKARETAFVVEPGQESALIYLYAESMILLGGNRDNKESQWQVPFTSFFQSKDEVADFRWRGGWADVNRAKAERSALVLDLRNPSGFPPASGSLADWATTGTVPGPSLKQDSKSTKESQAVVPEKDISSALPSPEDAQSREPIQRRKKRSLEPMPEAIEEEAQPWVWRWRWVLFAALAVIAMAVGIVIAMVTSPRIDSSVHNQGQRFPTTAVTSSNTQSTTPTNVPASDTSQTAFAAKPLVTATNATTVSPPPQIKPSAPVDVYKDGTGGLQKTNSATPAQPAPQVQSDNAALLARAFGSLPQGDVYVVLKDENDLNTTPLPTDLAAKLVAWKDACHYSIGKTSFVAPTNSSPTPTSDKFALRFAGRTIYYNTQSIQIDQQTLDETFFIQFVKESQSISIIITNTTNAAHIFHFSKSLLNWTDNDISATDSLKQRLTHLFVFDAGAKPLYAQLRLITTSGNKTYISNANEYTISWKEAVHTAAARLDQDNKKLASDQKEAQIEDKVNNVAFGSVDSPLTLKNSDVKSFASFLLEPDSTRSSSKEPLLVQYAKKLLSSLSTSYLNGNLNLSFEDPNPPGNWAVWLKDIPTKLPNKLQGQGSIPDDQVQAFNQSITAFCNTWKSTFSSPQANELLSVPSDSLIASIGTTSAIDADKKAVQQDENNKNPLHKEDLSSVEMVFKPVGGPVPVIVFDSEDYHMISDANSGATK